MTQSVMFEDTPPYAEGEVVFLMNQGRFGRVLANGVNLKGLTVRVQPMQDGEDVGGPVVVDFEYVRGSNVIRRWIES